MNTPGSMIGLSGPWGEQQPDSPAFFPMSSDAGTTAGTPMSSAATVAEAPNDIKVLVMKAMKHVCKTYGGPRQYLQKILELEEEKKGFYDYIMQEAPPARDTIYLDKLPMPALRTEDFPKHLPHVLHPTQFDWSDDSSIKPHPDAKTVLSLTERIMAEGFQSADEVLLVKAAGADILPVHAFGPPIPPSTPSSVPLGAFTMGYIKGSARMNTLLTILSFFYIDKVKLSEETTQEPPCFPSPPQLACIPCQCCTRASHTHVAAASAISCETSCVLEARRATTVSMERWPGDDAMAWIGSTTNYACVCHVALAMNRVMVRLWYVAVLVFVYVF